MFHRRNYDSLRLPWYSIAAYSVQCLPPPGFEDTGITNLKCASGDCDVCGLNLSDSGLYCRPCLEEDIQKPIKYYSFKNLPTCSHCGALPDGSKTCSNCVEKTELENKRGKIRKRKHLTWNNTPLAVFNKLYNETLPKYVLHRFKFLILSKQFVIDVRQKRLKPGEVCLQHDFSEYLKIVHNEEVCINLLLL